MLFILLLQTAASAGMMTGKQDRVAFQPYRDCVIDRARRYAKSSEPVTVIRDAAYSDCRKQKLYAQQDILLNGLDYATKSADPNRLDAPKGASKNLKTLEDDLDQDIAAEVLRTRVK